MITTTIRVECNRCHRSEMLEVPLGTTVNHLTGSALYHFIAKATGWRLLGSIDIVCDQCI